MPKSISRRQFVKLSLTGTTAAGLWLMSGCRSGHDLDLALIGGTVYDGSGGQALRADIGIKAGRIVMIGDLRDQSVARKIDVSGLAVCPGFIDFHSHSDDELFYGGEAQSKIRQGVTTEVLGQDGGSYAPLNEKMRERMHLRLLQVFKREPIWEDFAGYFSVLERRGMITNAISMLGQGTLRGCVVGENDRPATAEETAEMVRLAQIAFAQGAFGISSGLEYTPGSFASTEEIIAVCKSMNGRGIYSTHMRNEDDTVLEALAEAIEIARAAGVRLNISHMKASGGRNWHKLPEMLRMMDEARAGGMPVTCDRYPYVAYNTGLSSLFPLWSREGGRDKFMERLSNTALGDSIRSEVMGKVDKIGGWKSVMVASLPKNEERRKYEGRHFESLSEDGTDPYQLLLDLVIREEGGGDMVGFAMSEDNTSAILGYPYCMTASDASALAVEGRLRRGNPHPRSFGTFPRLLGKYVREDGLMELSEAIRKVTSLPAECLNISDRGMLKPGNWADIAVFDPARVIDNATWSAPHQYPTGVAYVVLNGTLVVDNEQFNGKLAGRVIRSGAAT